MIRRVSPSTLLLLAAVCGACTSADSLAPQQNEITGEAGADGELQHVDGANLPLTLTSGMETPARSIVRDDRTWLRVWSAIWRNHHPVPPAPAIDFSHDMVVVAAMAIRPSSGYSVLLVGARSFGLDLEITVRSQSPGPDCAVRAALTQPVDVARIPRTQGKVRFREPTSVLNCS